MPGRLSFKTSNLLKVGVLAFFRLPANGLDIDPTVRKCGYTKYLLNGFLDLSALLTVLN